MQSKVKHAQGWRVEPEYAESDIEASKQIVPSSARYEPAHLVFSPVTFCKLIAPEHVFFNSSTYSVWTPSYPHPVMFGQTEHHRNFFWYGIWTMVWRLASFWRILLKKRRKWMLFNFQHWFTPSITSARIWCQPRKQGLLRLRRSTTIWCGHDVHQNLMHSNASPARGWSVSLE